MKKSLTIVSLVGLLISINIQLNVSHGTARQVWITTYPEQRAEEFDNDIRLRRRLASLAAAFASRLLAFLAAGASTARLLRRRSLPAVGRT